MRFTLSCMLLLCLLSIAGPAHALIAPSDLVYTAPVPGLPNVRVVRSPGQTDAVRIETEDGEILRSFARDELVHRLEVRSFTRDGAPWMQGSLVLQDGNLFVIRLASKRLLVFDLENVELLSPPPPQEPFFRDFDSLPPPRLPEKRLAEIHANLNAKAIENLRSVHLNERIVAATLCGENGLREAIPILRELAKNDPGHWMRYTSAPGPGKRVYPVREAAQKALSLLEDETRP